MVASQLKYHPRTSQENLLHRVPLLVEEIIERLERLSHSNTVECDKILQSFYDISSSSHHAEKHLDDEIEAAKLLIDEHEHFVFKIKDVVVLTQLLLDYLETLASPVISDNTLDQIINYVQKFEKGDNTGIFGEGIVGSTLLTVQDSDRRERMRAAETTEEVLASVHIQTTSRTSCEQVHYEAHDKSPRSEDEVQGLLQRKSDAWRSG